MGNAKDSRLTIRIPLELRQAAIEKARQEDITVSQVIRRYLKDWVASDPPTDEGEKPEKND